MLRSLTSAVSGLRGHQTMLDVIANNIANVNTSGFKTSSVDFTDVYYQTVSAASGSSGTTGGTNAKQIGYGSTVSSIGLNNTQGGYSENGKETNLYIDGEGYFVVKTASDDSGATYYTRVGNFSFDANGYLVDAKGNFVCGATGTGSALPTDPDAADMDAIKIDDITDYSSIAIGSDGKISAIDASGATVILGQVALSTFANPEGLTQNGSLYMSPSANSGDPTFFAPGNSSSAGSIISGGLEMSNVDLSKQFTDMIIAQRGFQANSRVITTSDEILQELVNLKR